MKTPKLLALAILLTASAYAQKPGPYVTLGGGLSQLQVSEFTVVEPAIATAGGDVLPATNRRSTVSAARLTVGYNFTENWSLQTSYTKYGAGVVSIALPEYSDGVWAQVVGAGPKTYLRNVLTYKPTSISLMPVFTKAVSTRARLIAGVGVTYSKVTSRFEATYKSGPANSGLPYVSYDFAEESKTDYSLIMLLGYDHKITDNISLGLTGSYTSMKMKLPTDGWGRRSNDSVSIGSFTAEFYVGWHW